MNKAEILKTLTPLKDAEVYSSESSVYPLSGGNDTVEMRLLEMVVGGNYPTCITVGFRTPKEQIFELNKITYSKWRVIVDTLHKMVKEGKADEFITFVNSDCRFTEKDINSSRWPVRNRDELLDLLIGNAWGSAVIALKLGLIEF